MNAKPIQKPKLSVRNARISDIDNILKILSKIYKESYSYNSAKIRGQINNYPEGVFVATFDDNIVGYCATFRISEAKIFRQHSWAEITGEGFNSQHEPDGDFLYGSEVAVDPDFRGTRIGQRLYNERKRLCNFLRLRGIAFGARIPGYARRAAQLDGPETYLEKVAAGELSDPVIGFQLKNGFEPKRVLKAYFPGDKESHGFAALMLWANPEIAVDSKSGEQIEAAAHVDTIRIGAVQYQQRKVASFEEFSAAVQYFVDVVSDYGGDFVVFPELFTLQLLSIQNREVSAPEAIASLSEYVDPFVKLMSDLALRYNINIIGGSLPTRVENGEIHNIAYVFLRDGSVHRQAKIHPTPNERAYWNISGGSGVDAIMTDCGPIGVLICYDSEFPELARHLADQGAQILFVPFCTDERQSYMRVRYCCQSRAIENQYYVVLAGNVGNLPLVHNMDMQYAQSCILTPCDFGFARDGVAADTTPNVEAVAIADVRISDLHTARNSGTVRNLKDRRFDLYGIVWRGES